MSAEVLIAMPALADESGRALVPSIKELVPTVKDLVYTVKPLDLRIEDMIRVKEAAKETTIELPADILFDFDKADIRVEAEVALAADPPPHRRQPFRQPLARQRSSLCRLTSLARGRRCKSGVATRDPLLYPVSTPKLGAKATGSPVSALLLQHSR